MNSVLAPLSPKPSWQTSHRWVKPWQPKPDIRSQIPMTVCLAAICTHTNNQEVVIAASDCMLTYADLIEFEPPQSKILYLNNKTLILYGGDTTDHVSIWRSAFQGKGKNTDSMTTAQIADAYALEFRNFRAKRAEMQVLTPLGLTLKSYAAKRHQMSDYQLSEL